LGFLLKKTLSAFWNMVLAVMYLSFDHGEVLAAFDICNVRTLKVSKKYVETKGSWTTLETFCFFKMACYVIILSYGVYGDALDALGG
jgi:hypothetical protein